MTFYDDYGDEVTARDVLDGDELTSYYAARRNRPGPTIRRTTPRPKVHDDGWVRWPDGRMTFEEVLDR